MNDYKPLPNLPILKQTSNYGYVIFGIFIGIIIAIVFVQLEISPQWITDQTCSNLTNIAYQYGYNQGIINTANFTTITGNFTYINNGSIGTQGVQDYCVGMIQNLNNNGGK